MDETIAYDDDEDENNLTVQDIAKIEQDTAEIDAQHLVAENTDQESDEDLEKLEKDNDSLENEKNEVNNIPDSEEFFDEQLNTPDPPMSLTEDVSDYDFGNLFDILQSIIHVHANRPKTRAGHVLRAPRYLRDYSQ